MRAASPQRAAQEQLVVVEGNRRLAAGIRTAVASSYLIALASRRERTSWRCRGRQIHTRGGRIGGAQRVREADSVESSSRNCLGGMGGERRLRPASEDPFESAGFFRTRAPARSSMMSRLASRATPRAIRDALWGLRGSCMSAPDTLEIVSAFA